MENIKVLALGGLDEEGKDLYCVEINNKIFVINCGFKYPTKLTPGIDFIIADFSYLTNNKEKIVAYILPKTKKNNFGALPYIYKECPAPIYCTKLTKDAFLEFAKEYKQENDFIINEIKLPSSIEITGYKCEFFSTCSSVPLSFGFSITTKLGNIVYSGDFVVEYNNTKYFNFDLNTIGKIAEVPTLLLMCDSTNANKKGYCSPNNRLTPHLDKFFKKANGRIFIGLAKDNLYNFEEVFKKCAEFNKKICFYDKETEDIYKLKKISDKNSYSYINSFVSIDDILRTKDDELVILIAGEKEALYEKASLLANGENELRQIKIQPTDTFILACPPNDNNEVIFTTTIDELYRSGCHVRYLNNKAVSKMHAFEEDIKMLLSLLKPKYYFPIEGYYVNLLANAKIAFDMGIGLSHNNIFLLDNGQTLYINETGTNVDFNFENKLPIGDVMIDGIGVGDVVNEIILERNRLSEDGVIVMGCGVSLKNSKIEYGPDIQMRGFLFLKDKDADLVLKEVTKMFTDQINDYLIGNRKLTIDQLEKKINENISKFLFKQNNRNPLIKSNIICVD